MRCSPISRLSAGLRLLVGRRIGVRHDYEPIALIWTGLKATEPIADPVFEIDGFQGLGQGATSSIAPPR
jgi:hypothetical protein